VIISVTGFWFNIGVPLVLFVGSADKIRSLTWGSALYLAVETLVFHCFPLVPPNYQLQTGWL
jgi:hypothetical protein